MVYLVASLASMIMLAGSMYVIFATIRASHGRIVGALLGQSVERDMIVVYRDRPRARVNVSVRRPMQPLRAAA